jgi:hypothetical protein
MCTLMVGEVTLHLFLDTGVKMSLLNLATYAVILPRAHGSNLRLHALLYHLKD